MTGISSKLVWVMSSFDDGTPNINLFNFEEPFAENSKYVLTSPRSLKACGRIGVKPMELLHKPLSEFEDEYYQRLSHDLIHQKYQRHEKERLRMLRYCREERARIAKEEEELQRSITKQRRTGNLTDFLDHSKVENSNEKWYKRRRDKSDSYSGRFSSVLDSNSDSENETKLRSGLSPKELRRNSKRSPYSENSGSRMASDSLKKVFAADGTDSGSFTKPKPARGRLLRSQSEAKDATLDLNNNEPRKTLRRSLSNKNVTTLQRATSVDNFAAILPPQLRRSVSNLSESDMKILNVMITKASREEEDRAMRAKKKLELAEQKNAENEMKQVRLKQHHMLLADKMREFEHLKEKQAREIAKQLEEERKLIRSEIESKQESWQKEYSRQLKLKNNEVLLKRMQKNDKKKLQEENLAKVAEEKDCLRSATHAGQVDRLEKAAKNKELQIELEKAKRHHKNMEEKMRHEIKKEEAKRKLMEDQKAIQYAIEAKQRQAELNYRTLDRQNNLRASLNTMKNQARKEQQEETFKKIQDDLEMWQKELRNFHERTEERAAEDAKKTAELRSKKAMMDRIQKEHKHIAIKTRLKEDEKIRQAELKSQLNRKEEKSKMIIEDKKDFAKASREAALASRTIRDFIKEKTIKSSFDKMASEAERMARIERKGFRGPTKNVTTMKIGDIIRSETATIM